MKRLETIIENNTEEVAEIIKRDNKELREPLGFAGFVEDAITSLKYTGAILATIGAIYLLYSK